MIDDGPSNSALAARRYDRIVVSTSPVPLIEAIYLRLTGHSCLVVDRAEKIGGAWGVTDLPHYSDAEEGPHYFAVTPAVLDLLNLLGLEMERLTPRERWFLRGRFLGIDDVTYDRHWVRTVSHTYPGSPLLHRAKVISQFARQLVQTGLNPWATKRYMTYPRRGLPGMLSRFAALMDTVGVDLRLECELTDIRIETDRDTTVAVVDGEPIACGEVVLTSYSRLASLEVDGHSVTLPTSSSVRLLDLQLLLDDPRSRRFSVLKFPKGEAIIDYVTDVTALAVPRTETPQHGRFLLARCVQPDLPQTEDSARAVIDLLKSRDCIAPEARMLWHSWYYSDRECRSDEDWNGLSADHGIRIRALDTASLGTALAKYEPRWRPVFEAHLTDLKAATGRGISFNSRGLIRRGPPTPPA